MWLYMERMGRAKRWLPGKSYIYVPVCELDCYSKGVFRIRCGGCRPAQAVCAYIVERTRIGHITIYTIYLYPIL